MSGPFVFAAVGIACAFRVMAVIKIRNSRKSASQKLTDVKISHMLHSSVTPLDNKENDSSRNSEDVKTAECDSNFEKSLTNITPFLKGDEIIISETLNPPRHLKLIHPLIDSSILEKNNFSKFPVIESGPFNEDKECTVTPFASQQLLYNSYPRSEPAGWTSSSKYNQETQLKSPKKNILSWIRTTPDSKISFLVIPLNLKSSNLQSHQQIKLQSEIQKQITNQNSNQNQKNPFCAWCGAEDEEYCCGFGVFN